MVTPAHSYFSPDRILAGQKAEVRQRTAVAFAPNLRIPVLVLATALAYYFGTKLGFLFTPAGTPIGTLWPPNAILLAALLLTPTRIWPFLLLGVLPAHLLVQIGNGVPPITSIGWFFGNSGEALLGAACIRYFGREQRPFESLRGTVAFLVFGVLVAPFLTSFLDAAVVVLSRRASGYWMPWTTRLSSNMISELIFVPIVVICGARRLSWFRTLTFGKSLEAILVVFGAVILSLRIFGTGNLISSVPALICAPWVFLLWAALRFDLSVLSASLLAIALISIWNVMIGHDPLPRASMTENVLFLHFSLLVFTLPLVLLGGYVQDYRRALASLSATRNHLINWEEKERQLVGRELHNNIVQQLALIAAEVDRMGSIGHLPGGMDLKALYREVTQVSDATRDLSNEVHPFVLEYAGLEAGLRSLCRRAARQSGIDIRFAQNRVSCVGKLAKDVSLCLYRVAQEALQNIVTHSRAGTATVDLTITERNAVLRIADDGIGIPSEEYMDYGIGLANVRQRLIALNGACDIVSASMKGTTITASVPLSAE